MITARRVGGRGVGSNYNKATSGKISRPQNAKAPQNRASPERVRAAVASRPRQIRGDGERAGEKKFSSWVSKSVRQKIERGGCAIGPASAMMWDVTNRNETFRPPKDPQKMLGLFGKRMRLGAQASTIFRGEQRPTVCKLISQHFSLLAWYLAREVCGTTRGGRRRSHSVTSAASASLCLVSQRQKGRRGVAWQRTAGGG